MIIPNACTPKFESHKIYREISPSNKMIIFSAHNKNSNIAFAIGMSVYTKGDNKFDIGIRNLQ